MKGLNLSTTIHVFLLTEDMALIHCLLAIGVGWCVCFYGSYFHMNAAQCSCF